MGREKSLTDPEAMTSLPIKAGVRDRLQTYGSMADKNYSNLLTRLLNILDKLKELIEDSEVALAIDFYKDKNRPGLSNPDEFKVFVEKLDKLII